MEGVAIFVINVGGMRRLGTHEALQTAVGTQHSIAKTQALHFGGGLEVWSITLAGLVVVELVGCNRRDRTRPSLSYPDHLLGAIRWIRFGLLHHFQRLADPGLDSSILMPS